MPSSTIDIEIRARTEALTAELAKAGNLSQKQADKIAKEFVRAGKEAEKTNAKAAGETQKHWTGAAKKIASALGDGTIPKFEKLAGVTESLGGAMGASALGIGLLTGGIALAGAAAITMGSAVLGTIRNVDALSASLTDADRTRLAPYIRSLEDADSNLTKMDQSLTGLQIQLASLFSPAVIDAADAVTGLARAGQDAHDWMNQTFAKGTIGYALFSLTGTGQMLDFLDTAGKLGAAYSSETGPIGKVVKQFSTNDLAASLGLPAGAATSKAVAAAPTTIKSASPRVQAAKKEVEDLDALYLELAQNLNSYDAARNLAAQEARQKEADDEERLRQQGLAAEKEYRDQQVALAKEAADKQLEYTRRVQEDSKSTASNVGSFVGGVSDLVSSLYEQAADNAEEGSVREKKARKTAFAVAKAAAIAQAAINTALAVSQALTMVFPLNYINAAIVGALGAAEVGVIAAKQMPTAHSGGMVATAPDEQPIMALRGEAVLSRQAVQDLGGEQAVSNANRRVGTGDGMVGTFAMVYEHRSYDAFMARDLRRPTGAVRQAIHGTGNAGLIKRSG